MRVCQFRHFGVARLPNGAAEAYTENYFTGAKQRVQTAISHWRFRRRCGGGKSIATTSTHANII
jgi:hypothetical protein